MLIKQEDVILSVQDALQFISYYHPTDFIQAVYAAYQKEESEVAKVAMAQILINSRLSAEGRRPLCQDTGIVTVFVKLGMDVRWDATCSIYDMINQGVRQAYQYPDNPLRASILNDPSGARQNTQDNTPAVIHVEITEGNQLEIGVTAKGGGSEAKSRFAMLNPSDDIIDWVLQQIPTMGSGWCPPGIIGIGIGGTAEKAMLLAKESLMEPINIYKLKEQPPQNNIDILRLELYERINNLGIGAQGLGGLTTVLDVKIKDYPCHAANKPIALIPNCAATRHTHFTLDGTGPALQSIPDINNWPLITEQSTKNAKHVNLDEIRKDDLKTWKLGETLLLSGKMLTGRDAAHKRIADMLKNGGTLPPEIDFTNRFIYYVGPVDAVGDEVIGPAGPTTATRMDKFTELMLSRTGLIGMIGKAERGSHAIESIRRHRSVYLIAVGGAAYLVSKAIIKTRIVAFADLGMEAIHEFTVKNMPVTVAVDTDGHSIHQTGPKKWQQIIFERQ